MLICQALTALRPERTEGLGLPLGCVVMKYTVSYRRFSDRLSGLALCFQPPPELREQFRMQGAPKLACSGTPE